MATNATERNKTLQEIIEWCENSRSTLVKFLQQTHLLGIVGTTSCNGRIRAYEDVINHCKDMLGSGSMQSGRNTAQDQSEGAEISNREELTELVARKLWLEWNCELEGIDKTADDWAKLDSGTVFDKAEADGWRNVAWQILEGLRRYKVRKYKKWREERGLGKTTNEMAIDR